MRQMSCQLRERREKGAREPAVYSKPKEPSAEERAIHETTHLPFKSWCPDCVAGRGRDLAHKRILEEQDSPAMQFGYSFLKSRGSESQSKVLLVYLSSTSYKFSAVVPRKGALKGVVEGRVVERRCDAGRAGKKPKA